MKTEIQKANKAFRFLLYGGKMIKSKLVLAAYAAMSLALISCGSSPKEEPEIQEENVSESTTEESQDQQQISEDTAESNEAALSKIESSRQDAINAGAQEAAPDALNSAQEEHKCGKSALEKGLPVKP